MKIRLIFGLLFATTAFAQSSDFTQNFGAVPPINRGQIVKMSSTGQVVPMLTTDTTGAIGIATTSTTSSNVLVTLFGAPLVSVDGSCTPGNVVLISTTAAGQGHCASVASNQVIGIATTVAANGFATVQLAPLSSAGASGVAPNNPLPASSSGPGPVFNVKNYGAKGDAQSSQQGVFSNNSPIVTCANCHFQNGKTTIGMAIWGNRNSSSSLFTLLAQSTITSIDSDTQIHVSNNAGVSETGFILWGDIDDTQVAPAVTAALAASLYLTNQGGYLGKTASAPTLYFPAGSYLFCNQPNGVVNVGSSVNGFEISGSGSSQSILYFGGSGCTNPNNSAAGALINTQSGSQNISIHGLTVNGALGNGLNQSAGIAINGGAHMWDVNVDSWGGGTGAGVFLAGSAMVIENVHVTGSIADGILCIACSGEMYSSGGSNNANNASNANLRIANVTGLNGGGALRVYGGLIDECGANATGCTQIQNSHDVWLIGALLFGTNSGSCLNVDGHSLVHVVGGVCGSFGTDTNVNGPVIQAGGVLQASDFRMNSTGTGKCATNSGILNDNGGNTCESQFLIASGTSTGTAAVLTVTTLGANANTNCSVGDALVVQGASIAGYNGYYAAGATTGITAVTATTISYTTTGSNLGALGAGGVALCRNLQTYSGTLPRALLNNPIPNTCYITGTFAATTAAAPMCAFKLGSATNVSSIKATSTTTTACTVAPVVTISDGTISETLTITTAKSIWDSSVDASSGVGTSIFKPNGTITLSNTVGTCTTPPTNFSVSYNISPILSN